MSVQRLTVDVYEDASADGSFACMDPETDEAIVPDSLAFTLKNAAGETVDSGAVTAASSGAFTISSLPAGTLYLLLEGQYTEDGTTKRLKDWAVFDVTADPV